MIGVERKTFSGSPADVDLTRELDILLAPLSKQLRYPLPVPVHLANSGISIDSTSPALIGASAAYSPKRLGDGGDRKPNLTTSPSLANGVPAEELQENMTRALKRQALQDCTAKVASLQAWQTRVEEALLRGLDSQRVLEHVLGGISSMRAITKSVQDQSNSLSRNASVLMARKVRLVQVQEELQRTIQHFTHMEDLCREAEDSMLTATSPRFPQLFQDLEREMQFLSRNTQFKSAKMYAMKLAVAQEKTAKKLMNAVKVSFAVALRRASERGKQNPAPSPSAASLSSVNLIPAITGDAESESQVQLQESIPSVANVTMTPQQTTSHASIGLGLVDLDNPTDSFLKTLRYLNEVFLEECANRTSLRRMAEMRSSFSHVGAEAFGEEPVSSIEEDPMLMEMLRYYCEARAGLVGPLLRSWLTVWCEAGTVYQQQQQRLTLQTKKVTPSLAATEANEDDGGGAAASTSAGHESQSGEEVTPLAASKLSASGNLEASQAVGGAGKQSVNLSGSQQNSPLTGLVAAVGIHTQLPQLAEHICSLLETSLHEEKKVLDEVWLRTDFADYVFPKLVSDIAEELYHAFRARLVRVNDIEELADTVEHIQLVNLRQVSDTDVVQELSRLWVRMIQDVQERMIFRTSVCLRQDVGRGHPTKQLVQQYTDIITAGATPDQALPLVPGVQAAVYLLNLLYPTLEFSVFSVFAEEAVNASLQLTKELGSMLSAQTRIAPWAGVMSLAVQLLHLLYVRNALTRIDANITVVEKRLDFSQLAKKHNWEIVQSSREAKKVVESEVQTCSTKLSQCLCETVAKPMTGTSRMTATAVDAKLKEMEDLAAKGKYLVFLLIRPQHAATQEALALAVDGRVRELTHEVAEMRLAASEAPAATAPPPATSK